MKKRIPKYKLKKYRYYLGNGRNANIGYWTGKDFLTIGLKFDQWLVKYEPYERGNLCFVPYELIDDTKYDPNLKKHRKTFDTTKIYILGDK